MYENYYDMQDKAFPCQPTPSVFFESPVHKGAVRFLLSGIEEQEPFLLVTGNYGMGKTLLCLRAVRYLAETGRAFVDLSTPVGSYRELLDLLLIRCGIAPDNGDEEALQAHLLKHVQGLGERRRTFTVLLDEVQDYQASTLSKIRVLSNFNVDSFYPLQFILFAHESLVDLLAHPSLEPLDQRIRRRYVLCPFTYEETKEYIYFRLLRSGASGSPYFPDSTIEQIQRTSGGIPRFINNICDSCLLIGAARELRTIDPGTARAAIEMLGLNERDKRREHEQPAEAPAPPAAERPAESAPVTATPVRPAVRDDEDDEEDERERARRRRPMSISPALSRRVAIWVFVALILATLWRFRMDIYTTLVSQVKPAQPEESQAPGPSVSPAGGSVAATQDRQDAVDPVPATPAAGVAEANRTGGAVEAIPEPLGLVSGLRPSTAPAAGPAGGGAPAVVEAAEGAFPYSLLIASTGFKEVAMTIARSMTERGVPNVYVSEAPKDDEESWWAVYQGFYASSTATAEAIEKLRLENSTVVKTPFAIAVSSSGGDGQAVAERLVNSGHLPYRIQEPEHAGRLLVGAYQDLWKAYFWQQQLEAEGFQTTIVRR